MWFLLLLSHGNFVTFFFLVANLPSVFHDLFVYMITSGSMCVLTTYKPLLVINFQKIWFSLSFFMWRFEKLPMNTRYSVQPELSSNNISITISSSSSLNSTPRGDNSHVAASAQERSPSSSYIRLAMKVSRARWFIFLRRVFHYQNGSRSDLGSNPFNSSTWMMSELIALLVQLTVITFTLAISKEERPIWPVRLWITGYDVGCLLNLMLLYGRYRQQDVNEGNGFSLGDIEQQQRGTEETR